MGTHWWELIDKRQGSGNRVVCPYPFIRKGDSVYDKRAPHVTCDNTTLHCWVHGPIALRVRESAHSWYGELYIGLGPIVG
jgi:hypothetical protein